MGMPLGRGAPDELDELLDIKVAKIVAFER